MSVVCQVKVGSVEKTDNSKIARQFSWRPPSYFDAQQECFLSTSISLQNIKNPGTQGSRFHKVSNCFSFMKNIPKWSDSQIENKQVVTSGEREGRMANTGVRGESVLQTVSWWWWREGRMANTGVRGESVLQTVSWWWRARWWLAHFGATTEMCYGAGFCTVIVDVNTMRIRNNILVLYKKACDLMGPLKGFQESPEVHRTHIHWHGQ